MDLFEKKSLNGHFDDTFFVFSTCMLAFIYKTGLNYCIYTLKAQKGHAWSIYNLQIKAKSLRNSTWQLISITTTITNENRVNHFSFDDGRLDRKPNKLSFWS